MSVNIAVWRGYRPVCLVVAVTLAGTLSACGGSSSVQSSPGVTCTNYVLHGTGSYHNEVSVRVEVSNSTAHPARYAIDVELTTSSHDGPGGASSSRVTIRGSVPSHASAELGRKVLTAGPVQRCRAPRITPLSGS
jgi:hypothetical protein